MKFIEVTRIERELNEKAQERYDAFEDELIKQANGEEPDEVKIFRNLDIPIPDHFKQDDTPLNNRITFHAIDDYDIHESEYLLKLDLVKGFQRILPTSKDIFPYTVVFFEDEDEITIKEDIKTIKNLIK